MKPWEQLQKVLGSINTKTTVFVKKYDYPKLKLVLKNLLQREVALLAYLVGIERTDWKN
jgi:hypothetical protein